MWPDSVNTGETGFLISNTIMESELQTNVASTLGSNGDGSNLSNESLCIVGSLAVEEAGGS